MKEGFEKTTKELLKDVKGPAAKAITVMAMNIDNKLDEILEAIRQNKVDTNIRISEMEKKTDEKFTKLKVVLFFSENPVFLYAIIAAILIIAFKTDILQLLKFLK